MSDEPKVKLSYIASIADSTTAIKRSGKNTGGGSITYDLAEDEMGALAAHIPLVQTVLRVTVEVVSLSELKLQPQPDMFDEETDVVEDRPAWARRPS